MLQPGIEQIVVTPTAVLVVLKPSEEGGSLSIVLLSKQSGIYSPACPTFDLLVFRRNIHIHSLATFASIDATGPYSVFLIRQLAVRGGCRPFSAGSLAQYYYVPGRGGRGPIVRVEWVG